MGVLEELLAEIRALKLELIAARQRDGQGAGRFVSPKTYARKHSISVSTVRKAIREQRLDVARIGRAVRILEDAQIRRVAPGQEETRRDKYQRRAEAILGLRPRATSPDVTSKRARKKP